MYYFNDDLGQQALGFLVSQTAYIEPIVYRTKYPPLFYADLVPIDMSAGEWSKSVTFYSIDQIGRAEWLNANTNDIPLADFTRAKHESAIEMAGIGYRYNLEELGQAMMVTPNVNLTTERADAARRACETKSHNVTVYGDTAKTWPGLINNSAVQVITAEHNWQYNIAQSPALINAILDDINNALTDVWLQTLTVEMANVCLMPLRAMKILAQTQLPNTTMNLLQWIKENNIVTQQIGGAVEFRGVRGLDTAGSGGTGRMIAYRRDPEAIKLHYPMRQRFFAPRQVGAFNFEVPSMFRMGGLELRLPATMRYVDNIV